MTGFAVATIFSAVDKFSPVMSKAQNSANKFAVGAKAAFRSVIPEASRLNDIIKGVAIGNLVGKGLSMAVGAIKNNVGQAIAYASDLREVEFLVKEVFTGSEAAIDAWAKSTQKQFGLTTLQAKNFSTNFGAIFKSMGMGDDMTMAMSTKLAEMAGDLSSFYNLDIEDAFSKLQSGMLGKAQPLQAIGIDVSATRMEEFAKAQGLTWKNMDRVNQTMLRYKYIMEQTKMAQGDFAKEGASWAVSSRVMQSALNEMMGNLAEGFMPTLINLADMVTEVAQRISAWATENKQRISEMFSVAVEKAMIFGQFLIGVIQTVWRFKEVIILAAIAFKTWKVVSAVNVALKAFRAAQLAAAAATTAGAAATGVATGAMTAFTAAISANPIGAIITGVVLLVTIIIMLMVRLSKEVGGLGNAFKVVGQTIMKVLLTPVNLVLSVIKKLIPIAALIGAVFAETFMAIKQWLSPVIEAIKGIAAVVASAFKAAWQKIIEWLRPVVTFFAKLIESVTNIAKRAGSAIADTFKAVGQTIMKWVSSPFDSLIDALQFLLPIGARVGVVLSESFTAIGQTIMKALLTPINLVIEGIKGVLTVASKLPGSVGGFAGDALKAASSFQDKMNTMMTGSTSTLLNDGLNALLDPAKAAKDTMMDKIRVAESAAMSGVVGLQEFKNKVGVKVEGIDGFQDKMNIALTGSTSTLFNSGLSAYAGPYRNARDAELARREAARETAGEDDDPMKETNGRLDKLIALQNLEIEAIEGLGKSSGKSPAQLRWGAMGTEDYWEIARTGI